MKHLIVGDQRRLGQFLKQGLTERACTFAWVRACREARDPPRIFLTVKL